MRTIPEVIEDIKNILNEIERTEECAGETLVDIDELVNEILTINLYKGKAQTNADRIRSMSDEELADMLNNNGSYVENGEPKLELWLNEKQIIIDDSFGLILAWLQAESE